MVRPILDVAIVGGGPAGLSAALVLGRSLRRVAVVDEGQPRNAVTPESHGFLTRDGIHPLELRRIARKELDRYEAVTVLDDRVVDAETKNGLFDTVTGSGRILRSRKLVFATGVRDQLPAIRGLREVYGRSVFPCPYCDGWERRGESLALLGNGQGLFHFIKMIRHWSEDLIVFSDGPARLDDGEKQALALRNIRLAESPVAELRSTDGRLEAVVLDGGESVPRSGGFILDTGEKQACSLPGKLGVPLEESGGYETDKYGWTAIGGLAVIGDAKNTFTGLVSAACEGYEIGARINQQLIEEDWERQGGRCNG